MSSAARISSLPIFGRLAGVFQVLHLHFRKEIPVALVLAQVVQPRGGLLLVELVRVRALFLWLGLLGLRLVFGLQLLLLLILFLFLWFLLLLLLLVVLLLILPFLLLILLLLLVLLLLLQFIELLLYEVAVEPGIFIFRVECECGFVVFDRT